LTVADPAAIDLGERGIWFGIKQTLGGATALFGNADRLQAIKITMPGADSVTLHTAGDSAVTVTLTNPAGSTSTASGKIVSVTGPVYLPNSVDGNQKVVTVQLTNALAPN
jgi:hypothetical protein